LTLYIGTFRMKTLQLQLRCCDR